MTVWIATGLLIFAILLASPAWADGTQFAGNCSTIAWNANTETDLAGYKLYDRVSLTAPTTLIATYGAQITSVSCASLNLNAGQHYLSISSFDTSSNESARTAEIPIVLYVANAITDLRVTVVNATDMTLAFTEVDGGTGLPASYDIRLATPLMNWGTASSVSAGTCSSPVAGTTIGATKTCTVTGLSATTAYQFQLVPFRGTETVDAVYGPLSNITGATTGGGVPGATNRLTIATDDFARGNGALPNPPWMSGYTNLSTLVEVSTNVGKVSGGIGTGAAVYNPANIAFAPNQWTEMRIDSFSGGATETLQLGVRWTSPPTGNGYACIVRRNGTYTSAIRLTTNGSQNTVLTENATTWVATNTFRCEVHTTETGETIDLYRNADVSPLLSYIDTTRAFLTGQPGVLVNGSTEQGDNWQAGTFTTSASADTCGCDEH